LNIPIQNMCQRSTTRKSSCFQYVGIFAVH
jgi:hypothetical protein